jgi:hypothetical protein
LSPWQLVGIYTRDFSSGRYSSSSYPDYLDFRRQADAFADIAVYDSAVLNLAGGEGTERLRGAFVTSNYFEVLGVGARVGRTLRFEDDAQASASPWHCLLVTCRRGEQRRSTRWWRCDMSSTDFSLCWLQQIRLSGGEKDTD